MEWANIREVLPIEGRQIVMITQHDEMDYLADGVAFFCLHLDDGSTLRIVVTADGQIWYEPGRAMGQDP